MGKPKVDPVKTPDYAGAAQATAGGSTQAALASNRMANQNIYTPLGSRTSTQSGSYKVPGIGGNPGYSVPTYDQSINLSPDQQYLYQGGVDLQKGLLGLGQGALQRTGQSFSQPFYGVGGQQPMWNAPQRFENAPQQQSQPQQRVDPNRTQMDQLRQEHSDLGAQKKAMGRGGSAEKRALGNQQRALAAELRRMSSQPAQTPQQIPQQQGTQIPQQQVAQAGPPQGLNAPQQRMGAAQPTGFMGTGSPQQPQQLQAPQTPVQQIADKSYAMQTARLDPQWQQNEERQRNMLANQGLAPGGEAYNNAMRTFGERQNDAYNNARLSSISTMPQTYGLDVAQRMQPLNELQAIMAGSQAQMPQFNPVQYQGTQGPDMLRAANLQGAADQNIYNQQMGARNAFTGGLMELAGTGIGAVAGGPLGAKIGGKIGGSLGGSTPVDSSGPPGASPFLRPFG